MKKKIYLSVLIIVSAILLSVLSALAVIIIKDLARIFNTVKGCFIRRKLNFRLDFLVIYETVLLRNPNNKRRDFPAFCNNNLLFNSRFS